MEYYHVCVTPKSDKSKVEVRLDLTREELEERFLAPYRKGLTMVIRGKSIQKDDIERIRISKTDQDSNHLGKVVADEGRRRAANGFLHIGGSSTDELIANKGEDITDEFITGPPGWELETQGGPNQQPRPARDAREVFVVHGRNDTAREAMFAFLRSIDLHPLEWSEAINATGKASPYIGEILDAAFSRAHAVVVLFTPDDQARLAAPFRVEGDPLYETELTGQARPNVLFEAGMALGRDQNRTVLVELGNLRPFSDVAGRHAIRLDNSLQQRRALAQRLKVAGCQVDIQGTHWHKAGDFEAALAALTQEPSAQIASDEIPSSIAEQLRLSEDARELLIKAANDARGSIFRASSQGGVSIQAGGRSFVESGDQESAARWDGALKELLKYGLVNNPMGKGRLFKVTQEGYDVAHELGASE